MNFITSFLQNFVSKKETLLDLGCGIGYPTGGLICKKIIGIDVWKSYKNKYHSKYIQQDITDLSNIPSKSYDVVFALDIIEHLKKEEGLKLLDECKRIAKKRVFILTPIYWHSNLQNVINPRLWSFGNKYNLHRSYWKKEEFIKRGYKIIPDNTYILALKKIRS